MDTGRQQAANRKRQNQGLNPFVFSLFATCRRLLPIIGLLPTLCGLLWMLWAFPLPLSRFPSGGPLSSFPRSPSRRGNRPFRFRCHDPASAPSPVLPVIQCFGLHQFLRRSPSRAWRALLASAILRHRSPSRRGSTLSRVCAGRPSPCSGPPAGPSPDRGGGRFPGVRPSPVTLSFSPWAPGISPPCAARSAPGISTPGSFLIDKGFCGAGGRVVSAAFKVLLQGSGAWLPSGRRRLLAGRPGPFPVEFQDGLDLLPRREGGIFRIPLRIGLFNEGDGSPGALDLGLDHVAFLQPPAGLDRILRVGREPEVVLIDVGGTRPTFPCRWGPGERFEPVPHPSRVDPVRLDNVAGDNPSGTRIQPSRPGVL